MSNFNIDLKNISLIDFAKKEVDILKIDGVPVWYKYEDPNTPGRFLAYKLNQNATVNGTVKQVLAINPPIVTFKGIDDVDPVDINVLNPGTNTVAPFTGIDADLDGVDSGVDIDDNDPTVGSQVYVEILGSTADATYYQNNQEGLKFNHPVGSLVTVRVVAVAGKRFTEWSATGAQLLSSELVQQEISFTMPKTNVILTPTFATSADFQYSLTVNQDPGGSVSGGGSYKALQEVEITATPRIGYNFVKWESSDVVVYTPNEPTTKLLMPDSNVVVSPVFEAQEFAITLNDTAGGSLDVSSHAVSSGSAVVKFEETVEISAIADSSAGYSFVRWHISGFTFSGDINDPNLSFVMPAANITISAEFEAAEFDVVIAPTSTGTASGSGVYAPGTLVTISSSPPSTNPWAYEFAGWSASGVTLADANSATTTFTMPANNVNISFSYTKKKATVNVTLPTDGGITINGQSVTSLEVDAGSNVSISASVPVGYSFLSWTVSSNNVSLVDSGNASTSFVMPAETVELTYSLDFASYTLDVESNILTQETFSISIGGVLQSNQDFPKSFSIQAQSSVAIEISNNDSSIALNSLTASSGINNPSIDINSRLITFTMPQENGSITAEFIQTQFDLSIVVQNPFSGDTNNDSVIEHDMLVEISEDQGFTTPIPLEYLSSTSTATDAPVIDPSDLDLTGGIWFIMTSIPKDYWVRIRAVPLNGTTQGDWTSNREFTVPGPFTTSTLAFTNSLSTPFQMPSGDVRLTTNFVSQPIFRVIPVGGYDSLNFGIPFPIRSGAPTLNTGYYDGNDPDLMNMTVTQQSGTGLEYKYHRFETVSITINTFVADQDFIDRSDVAFGVDVGNYIFASFATDLFSIERISDQQSMSSGIDILLNPNIQGNTLTFKVPNIIDPEDHNLMIVTEYNKSNIENTLHLSIPGWSAPGSGDAGDRITVVDHTGSELIPTQGANTAGTSYTQGTQVTLTASGGNLHVFDDWHFAKWNSSDGDTFVPTALTHDLESSSITFTLGQDLSAEARVSDKLEIVIDYSEYTQNQLSDGEKDIIRDACDYLENIFKPIPGQIETYTLKITNFNDSAPGGTLASAGIRSWHSPSSGVWLPDVGYARFDPADTPDAANTVSGDKTELWYTAVHELLHAFGMSSAQWNNTSLGSKYDLIELTEDWGAQYKGTEGVAAYNEFWGTNLTRVPVQTKQTNANLSGGQAVAPTSSINQRYTLSWHLKTLTSTDVSRGTCSHADTWNAYTSESSSSTLTGGLYNVPATWELEIVGADSGQGYTMIGDKDGTNISLKVFTGSSVVFKSPFHASHPLEFFDEQGNQISVPFNSSDQTYTFTATQADHDYEYRCRFHSTMTGLISTTSSFQAADLVKYAVANTWTAHIAEVERRRSNQTTTTSNTLYETRKFNDIQQPLMDEILMTPYADSEATKMSSISAGMYKDLGWEIRDKFVDTTRPPAWVMEEATPQSSPSFLPIGQGSNYTASNTAHTTGIKFRVSNIPDWLANLSESNVRVIAHRKSFSFPADVSWNLSATSGTFVFSASGWSVDGSDLLKINSAEKTLEFIPINLSSGRSVGGTIVYDTLGFDESVITVYNAADTSQTMSSPFYWTVPGVGVTTDGLNWQDDSEVTILFDENSIDPIPYNQDYNVFGDSSIIVNFALGGEDANLFDINPASGTIRFKLAPDFENPQDANGDNIYKITVKAYDSENPEIATKEKLLSITIVNENDSIFELTIDTLWGSVNGVINDGEKTDFGLTAYGDPADGTKIGGDSYVEGTNITLGSIPSAGYTHKAWSSTTSGFTIADPSSLILQFTMPDHNVDISLECEEDTPDTPDGVTHVITGQAPGSNTGSYAGAATYSNEGTTNIFATGSWLPNPDMNIAQYDFISFTNNFVYYTGGSSNVLIIYNPDGSEFWTSPGSVGPHTSPKFTVAGQYTYTCSNSTDYTGILNVVDASTPTPDGTTRNIYLSIPNYQNYSSTSDKIYVQDQNGNELIPTQGGNFAGDSYAYGTEVTLTAYASSSLKLFSDWHFTKWGSSDGEDYVPIGSTHDLTASSITFLVGQDLACEATFIDNPDAGLILTEAQFDAMSTTELSQLTVVEGSATAGENEPSVGSVLGLYEVTWDDYNMTYTRGSIIDYGLVTEIIPDTYNNPMGWSGKMAGTYGTSYNYWHQRFKLKLKSNSSIFESGHGDFAQGWKWDILS